MTDTFDSLLAKVNSKLKETPLIYFSRDAERATGLENHLANFFIASVEKSYLASSLEKTKSFILEDYFKPTLRNTSAILESEEFLRFKEKSGIKDFYAQFFQPDGGAVVKATKLGGIVLNNKVTLANRIEDKFFQYNFLIKEGLPVPKGFIVKISEVDYSKIAEQLGSDFVIQEEKGHTGMGTYFISNKNEFDSIQKTLTGNEVKITSMIKGNSYTINAVVANTAVFVQGLQYQITGITELTPSKGSTVGNDFKYTQNLQESTINKIYLLVKKLGNLLRNEGYLGLFGVDLVIDEKNNLYIIEINARQTANIPLQTNLELAESQIPLALINLAVFLNLDFSLEKSTPYILNGAQIFLRSFSDEFVIKNSIKGGFYRLQGDNTAWDFNNQTVKDGVIYIDEHKDSPLIWQKDGYSLLNDREGYLLLLPQEGGANKKKFEEILRLQFKQGIIHKNNVAPWIIEALKTFKELVL